MSYINTKGINELGATFERITAEGNEVDWSDLGSVTMVSGRDGGNITFAKAAIKQINGCAFEFGTTGGGCGTTINGLDPAQVQADFFVEGGAFYSKVREASLNANSAAWLSNVEVLKTTQLGATVQSRNNAKLDHFQSMVINSGEYVRWNGTTFEGAVVTGGGGGASYINDLTDVDLTNAADGDIIGFDIATGKWKNGQLQLGSMTLAADPSPTLSADLSGANHNIDLQGGKALFSNIYVTLQDLPTSATYHGMFAHVHATGAAYYSHVDNVSGTLTWHDLLANGTTAPDNYTDPLSTVAYSGSYTDLINQPTQTLGGNSDVSLTTPSANQVLTYNGASWVNSAAQGGGGALTLNELTDVVVPTPNDGEFLQYTSQNNWQNVALFLDDLKSNSADGKYVVDVIGSDISLAQPTMPMLDDLTNVNTTDAADGRFVRRDEQVGVVPSVTISEDPAGNGVAGTLVVEARENLSFFMGVVFTSQLAPVWDNGSGLTLMPPDFGIYLVRGNDVDGLPGDSLFFMADTATGTDANGGPIWNNPGSYPSSGATILELVHDNQGNPVLDGNGAPTFVDVTDDRWKVTGTGWFTTQMLYAADSGQIVPVNFIGVTGHSDHGNTQSTITDVGIAGQSAVAEYKVQPLTSLDIVGAATGAISPLDNQHLVWHASASKFIWAAESGTSVTQDSIKQALIGSTTDPSAAGSAFVWNGASWEYGLVPSAYTLPVASVSTLGGVKTGGANVSIDGAGVISFTPAALTAEGIVNTMTGVDPGSSNEGQVLVWHESTSNLTWAALGGSYTLPLADGSTRGGIKIDSTAYPNSGGSFPTYISLTNEVIGVDVATLFGALSTALWADPTVYAGDIQLGNLYLNQGHLRLHAGAVGYESGEPHYQEPGTIRAVVTTGDIEAYIADGSGQNAAWISLSADTQGPTYTAGSGINIDGSNQITSTVADYSLPVASASTLGGIKVNGGGLAIAGDGILSADNDNTTYGGTGYISVADPTAGNTVGTITLDVTPEGLTDLALVGHTHLAAEITDLSDTNTTYEADSGSGGDYITIVAPSGGSSVGTFSLTVNPANETPALSVTGHTHTVSELTDYTAVTDTNTTYTSANSDITIAAPSGESTVGTITFNAALFASSDHDHDNDYAADDHDHALGDASDVTAAVDVNDNGKVLTYQGNDNGFTWETPASGGATNLGDLGDVTGGGEDGQVLTINSGAATFVDVPVTSDGRGIKTYTEGDVTGSQLDTKSLLITSSVFKTYKTGIMRYDGGAGESIEKVYLPLTMDPAGAHDGTYAEAGKFLAYETFTIINQSAGERVTVIEIYGWESNDWYDPFNPNNNPASGGEIGITVGGGTSSPGGGSSGRMMVQLSPGGAVTLAAYVNETTQKTDWLVVGQSGDASMLAV